MVATRGRTFKRPWRRSCHSSKLKSSSAPIGQKDSWCFHAVGSSNAPLLGSTAAEGLQRIGRTSIATRWRSCGLPQSASCSENFVIPPDVFGQTLRTWVYSERIGPVFDREASALLDHDLVRRDRRRRLGGLHGACKFRPGECGDRADGGRRNDERYGRENDHLAHLVSPFSAWQADVALAHGRQFRG